MLNQMCTRIEYNKWWDKNRRETGEWMRAGISR
jgi:hypothetical protein